MVSSSLASRQINANRSAPQNDSPRPMLKIGQFVKLHIAAVFSHCEKVDHAEINSLFDQKYSKQLFDVNFPFCKECTQISPENSKRYWTEAYFVRGKQVRVTSQWFETSHPRFVQYLKSKAIPVNYDGLGRKTRKEPLPPTKGRYRGNAIGNAQNLFIRNILSNLGTEAFSELHWNSTKEFFSHRCAYCGSDDELLMEHVIPINKGRLGEHKLGNLVPSCKTCNDQKADRDFRKFLKDNTEAIAKIEKYMETRNYVPLTDNEQIAFILDVAHKEVAELADRYIKVINRLFPQGEVREFNF